MGPSLPIGGLIGTKTHQLPSAVHGEAQNCGQVSQPRAEASWLDVRAFGDVAGQGAVWEGGYLLSQASDLY